MAQSAVESFAKNLTELTKPYGSVSRLAEYMGWSRVYMSRVIHGHASVSMEDAEKIAHHLGFDLSDLLQPPKKFLAAMKKCG